MAELGSRHARSREESGLSREGRSDAESGGARVDWTTAGADALGTGPGSGAGPANQEFAMTQRAKRTAIQASSAPVTGDWSARVGFLLGSWLMGVGGRAEEVAGQRERE